MHRRALAIILLLTCCVLAGCSAEPSGGGTKRIIFLTNGASPFFDAARSGLEKAGEDLKLDQRGLHAVLEVNDGTPAGQIAKLRQYGSQGDVAAIGISVTDAGNAAIADELKKLQAQGIKVLTLDGDLDRSKFRDARYAFIGTDNLAAGREMGAALRNLLPDGGAYVTFVGRTGSQNAMDRVAGVKAGAGDKFKAVDNMGDEMDHSRAKDNVRNAITNHPEVNALCGIWSYNGPAICAVLRELGRGDDFAALTFDAEPTALVDMEKGDLDFMVVQNPFDIGYQGVRMLTAMVENDEKTMKEMFPNYGQPEGDIFLTNLKVVVPPGSPLTKDMFDPTTEFLTLEQFKAWLAEYGLTGS